MQRAGSARAFIVAVLLFGAAGLGHSDEISGKPAKIAVTGESGTGKGLMVRVNLLDPENRPAPANKDFEVEVEGRSETGATEKSKAVVKAGETGTTIVLPFKYTGLMELKASNAELAEGGTITSVSAADTPPPEDIPPTMGARPAPWNPIIKLRYYPKRNLRADKNDPATISAALSSNNLARDGMLIYLLSDIGPLTPEFIKIPKGGREGKATLAADRPTLVQVWYDYSTPMATSADPPLTIKFSHPV
jgi:hypothetical protein